MRAPLRARVLSDRFLDVVAMLTKYQLSALFSNAARRYRIEEKYNTVEVGTVGTEPRLCVTVEPAARRNRTRKQMEALGGSQALGMSMQHSISQRSAR